MLEICGAGAEGGGIWLRILRNQASYVGGAHQIRKFGLSRRFSYQFPDCRAVFPTTAPAPTRFHAPATG